MKKRSANPLTTEVHSDLISLRDAWNSLQLPADGNGQLFSRYEWMDATLSWQPDASQPYFLLIQNQKKSMGILALSRLIRFRYGLPIKRLQFIQVPDAQQCQYVTSNSDRVHVAHAIAGYLSLHKNWDQIQLSRMHRESGAEHPLETAFREAGLRVHWIKESGNPVIQLNQTWQTYYATRSRRLKKGNNLVANKLRKAFKSIEVEWLFGKSVTGEQWSMALDEVIAVSAKSWKRSTGLTLDNPGPQAFIKKLSEHAIHQGWLSIWLLRLDGKIAAMEYQIIYNRVVHALRADYDEDLAELSPGTYLNWKILERLFEQGDLLRYEMGPGDNQYKQRWAESELPLYSFIAYNTTLPGRILCFIECSLKPVLKTITGMMPQLKNKRTID